MSATPQPAVTDRLTATRAFARSLNLLLKNVRLYGLEHKRCMDHFETIWGELQSSLAESGELLLGVTDGALLLDGVPLDCGFAERSFAQSLTAAGVSSIHFSQNATEEELRKLVTAFATSRSNGITDKLKLELPEGSGIRVNHIRFVASDGSTPQASVASQTTAKEPSAIAEARDRLRDPKQLLDLIATAEAAHTGEAAGTGQVVAPQDAIATPLKEEDILRVTQFLSRVGGSAAKPDAAKMAAELKGISAHGREVLYQALLKSTTSQFQDPSQAPDLAKLAEQLAIRFATESFERGELKINAVQQLLERMAKELHVLRQLPGAHEQKTARADSAASYAAVLDRQFWAELPEAAKRSVLLSDDCFRIPAKNIRAFIEQLLERRDTATATQVLRSYLAAVENADPDARRKAAAGVGELVDLYTIVDPGLLQIAVLRIGKQLSSEPSLEIQTLLSATFLRLSQAAAAQRDFTSIEQCLASLGRLEKQNPGLARGLKPRLAVENRLRDFVSGVRALPAIPTGLVDVLRRAPRAAAEEIALQFGSCVTREECNRYTDLLGAIGQEAVEHLRTILQTRPPSEAANEIGLLSRFDLAMLTVDLPDRICSWTRPQQHTAIWQIAGAAAPGYASLLLALIDVLDPLIVPQALDEVGLSNEEFNPAALIDLAAGGGVAADSPYVRLKAIEALGRLRSQSAERLLIEILVSKGLLGWHHARELRVAAAQALERIDPQHAIRLIAKSGLATEELSLRPLDSSPANGWVRQRRYPRVALQSLVGTAMTNRGKCAVSLERLSLGGGLATRVTRGTMAPDAVLELPCGLRPLRTRVLMHETHPDNVSFEIADISLDERSRLRRMIAQQLRHNHSAAKL